MFFENDHPHTALRLASLVATRSIYSSSAGYFILTTSIPNCQQLIANAPFLLFATPIYRGGLISRGDFCELGG